MAAATVFVDDAVLGGLPEICVKTGAATNDLLNITTGVGANNGLGLAWLLVLAGPLGWVGLLLFAATRRDELITVRLPYCEASYQAFDHIRHNKRIAGIGTVVLFVGALAGLVTVTTTGRTASAALAVAGCVALIIFVTYAIQAKRALVDVRLDGSRRWVTLSQVHQAFADAVNATQTTSTRR